jgi:hypothetical protein
MKQEILIQPKDLPYVWPEAAEVIEKGLSHSNGEVDADSFFLPIYTGKQYLWLGHAWATKSGRDFEPWIKNFDNIIHFAKINGCDFIEAKVRKGLAKKLEWDDKHSLVTLQI